MNALFSPAFILSAGTLLSYLLGVVRDIFFARSYGADGITDAYFSAFLISDLLLMICISSALLGIAVPLFMKEREKNEESGYATYGVFFTSLNTIFLAICIAGIIFAPQIFPFLFPEIYAFAPEEIVNLGRIFFCSNLFFGLSNFLGSFLMAHKHFLSTALSPLFYNVGILIGIFFFAEDFGIYAAGYGALFGSLMHLGVRIIEYSSQKYRFSLSYDWMNPSLHELGSSMILRWFTVAAFPIMMLGVSTFASFTEEGLYTIFLYARNIESAPVAIFGVAIATSVFPLLSQKFAQKKGDEMANIFWDAVYKVLFWTVPMAVGVYFFGDLFLGVVYGLIDDGEKMQWISSVLAILCFAIPLESLSSIFARTFNAMGDTKTPLIIAFFSLFSTFLSLVILFVFPVFSPALSIAIAYLTGFCVSLLISFYYLKKNEFFSSSFFPSTSDRFDGMKLSLGGSMLMILFFVLASGKIDNFWIELVGISSIGIFLYLFFITLFWRKDLLKKMKAML